MEQPAMSSSKLSRGNNESLPRFTPTAFSRLTVVETIYHQSADGDATVIGKPYNRILFSGEQLYPRVLTIGQEWVDISKGCWLERASQLVLHNNEGKQVQVIMTEEERSKLTERMVEIGVQVGDVVEAFSSIPPGGESCRISNPYIKKLRIRCVKGTAKVVISIVPE